MDINTLAKRVEALTQQMSALTRMVERSGAVVHASAAYPPEVAGALRRAGIAPTDDRGRPVATQSLMASLDIMKGSLRPEERIEIKRKLERHAMGLPL